MQRRDWGLDRPQPPGFGQIGWQGSRGSSKQCRNSPWPELKLSCISGRGIAGCPQGYFLVSSPLCPLDLDLGQCNLPHSPSPTDTCP
ncbi:hypothetical protein TrVFT333_001807 [Trichoderma virens FT-333]|nr:hypothetical protein TrVFT333_001807 [Trichoderma virens FT-333]